MTRFIHYTPDNIQRGLKSGKLTLSFRGVKVRVGKHGAVAHVLGVLTIRATKPEEWK